MSERITDDLCDRSPENDPRGSQAAEVLLCLLGLYLQFAFTIKQCAEWTKQWGHEPVKKM